MVAVMAVGFLDIIDRDICLMLQCISVFLFATLFVPYQFQRAED